MLLGALPSGVTLRRGSTGPAVTALQTRLAAIGHSPGPIDGRFGPLTETAVRAFQMSRSLQVDGVVGPATAAALGVILPAAGTPAAALAAGGGFPWGSVLLGVGVVGALVWVTRKGRRRATRQNPRRGGAADERAAKFYEDFHWGRRHRRRRYVRVAPRPSRLVKLGLLEAVTYSARKGSERLADYIHHFGEGGTRKPVLAADPRTRRLHIVGGGYDVRPEGITG